MSETNETTTKYVVLCVDAEPDDLAALQRQVRDCCGPEIEVQACSDAAQALALIEGFDPSSVRVPLIITEHVLPAMSGINLLLALNRMADYRATRKMLASSGANVLDLSRALNQGALHRNIVKPWKPEVLRDCVRSLLTSFFVHHAPQECDRFKDVLHSVQFPRAYWAAQQERRALDVQIKTLKRSFLANMGMSDQAVDHALSVGIDEALKAPPRQHFPAGAVLLSQGEPVSAIYVLVSGNVQLSRTTNDREVILHQQAGGRIIGLLSLAHGQRAFYTWRATTDVDVIPLSLEQLETALQANPWLGGYLVTSLVRTMGLRSKRTAQLLLEVEDLNGKLQGERDQLAGTLQQLEASQTRLVESQKMATLGQLSAGVAHELNNPIAAIQRAADFLGEDLTALLADVPHGETIKAAMLSALTSEPLSTREQRSRRAALARAVDSEGLAQRLLKAGITTFDQYSSSLGRLSSAERDRLLDKLERYHQLGMSLRSISTCSRRVSAIVQGLRDYTRADQAPVANVNLHEGIEGTLLMFSHDLGEVEVIKTYGELPAIECHVGEINQVWANIIANALQALNNKGLLRIETSTPDTDHVRVCIIDNGPGVPPENLGRVFDLNFTTKQGPTGFGLGLGLAICRQIVTRHDGTIEMESQPGRTCLTVVLPVRPLAGSGGNGEP